MKNAMDWQISAGTPLPFGATRQGEGVNFALYAKEAVALFLCLYDEDSLAPLLEVELDPLINRTGDVWHLFLKPSPQHFAYGYRLVDGQQKSWQLVDPYAKAVAGERKWGAGHGLYHPLGKLGDAHTFDWQDDRPPCIPRENLIIYEMHARGFTRDSSSAVAYPGTYQGIIEKIPYLTHLGINAIELLPVQEFNEREVPHLNPKTGKRLLNFFGYSPSHFFALMSRYAADAHYDNALIEFKTMVRELHRHGIEVILDVVFNHTGESRERATSFRKLDVNSYYLLDKKGNDLNFSGCGNTFNCNHPVSRELIIQALRHWVTEMHVDGFRFDLASILTRGEDGEPLAHAPLIEAITKDPVLAHVKLIAEAWDAAGLYQVGHFMPQSKRWSEWNGRYRDAVRRFIKGTADSRNAFATALCGSQDLYGGGRSPLSSINFVTCHDGFTLQDLVSYNEKDNWENDEDNRDGSNDNNSWNCGVEGPTTDPKILDLRERQRRNFHLALMVSQGVPMLFMGDEYGHSKGGNNNTWCQDNELNWFRWDIQGADEGFGRFYRLMIEFRKQHAILRRKTFLGRQDITWHGTTPLEPDWNDDNRFIAFTLNDAEHNPALYVAFNAAHTAVTVVLPDAGVGMLWQGVANTAQESPKDFISEGERERMTGNSILMAAHSSLILEATALN